MLVCQCNIITDRDIRKVVESLLDEDPWQIIVPAMVYKALAKRYKCSGCVPNVVDLIIKVTEEYHQHMAGDSAAPNPVSPRLHAMRRKHAGGSRERRSTSHRAAQRSAVS